MKKIPLILLLIAVIGFPLFAFAEDAKESKDAWSWFRRRPVREPVYPEILVTPGWLETRLDDPALRLVDARDTERFARGHLPGALHLGSEERLLRAIRDGSGVELVALLGSSGLSAGSTIVLYGDAQSYAELGRVFWLLDWAGCADLRVLDGGVAGWSMAGGKLSVAVPNPEAQTFEASPVDSARIDIGWLAERYGTTKLCEVLDLRDEEKWYRLDAPPGYAPGHVPHSLPYDFTALIPEDGSWPDPVTARASFGLLGPRERDYVDLDSVFTLMGEDAADLRPYLGYLLLRMMDIRVRVLCGGWADWSARADLPRVRIIDASTLRGWIEAENQEMQDHPPAGFALLDLRGSRDWTLRHLPGALPMPAHLLSDSLETLIADRWPDLARDELPLVFYCYGPECTRSRLGATKAARMGFRQLFIFRGGVAEWKEAGLKDYGRPVPQTRIPRPKKKERDPRRR